MLHENVSPRSRPRGLGDFVLGSWLRTAAVAAALVVLFAVLAGLVFSGRLGDLRYANIPVLHPYPPAGYYLNPFNPGDRGDLINAGEADRVKGEFLADGQTELRAVETGDSTLVTQADTGHAAAALEKAIGQYNAQGIFARQQTSYSSIVVGRQVDPNAPSVQWCIQERGSATITFLSRTTGQVVRQDSFQFSDKFWVAKVNGRYLITDAQISNRPAAKP